ncbi:MAG: hypothetical protein V4525_05140 [Pseudomonadota bacterium]
MRRTGMILGILVVATLGVITYFPAIWLVSWFQPVLHSWMLTQIEGSLWHGKLMLNSPLLNVDLPIQWQASYSFDKELGWKVSLADKKIADINYKSGMLKIQVEGASIPLSILNIPTKGMGTLSGNVLFSGIFNASARKGEGQIQLQSTALNNKTTLTELGEVGGSWSCMPDTSEMLCTVNLIAQPHLNLTGSMVLKKGKLSGAGSLQPDDLTIKKALQFMPPDWLHPIQLLPDYPIAGNQSNDPNHSALLQMPLSWKWSL